MRDDAFEFTVIHQLKNALRKRHRRMIRIAPGREGIGEMARA